jgi:crossover junction endodeoxyribonuclease RuvC
MTKWLGIDPGISGAVAVIEDGNITFYDTPTVQVKVGKSVKNQLDPFACSQILRRYDDGIAGSMMVTIEKVQPMPSFSRDKDGQPEERRTMGVTSAFNFGRDFGMWIGILAALNVPYMLAHPATWKRRILSDMEKGKDASRVKAMQLYPHVSIDLARKKDHGRADALLLARYGQLTQGVTPAAPEPVPTTLF